MRMYNLLIFFILHDFAMLLLWVLLSITIVSVSTASALKKDDADDNEEFSISAGIENDTSGHLFLQNGLFEGDLKLSEEFIQRYNLSSILGGVKTPNSDRKSLLKTFIETRELQFVTTAFVAKWESTLLIHTKHSFEHNVSDSTCDGPLGNPHLPQIYYLVWEEGLYRIENTEDGCFSNSVGRSGGK